MNETEKLLRKISRHDREQLRRILVTLDDAAARASYHPIKLKGRDIYRIRSGNFRILYHLEDNAVIVDSVRHRNEKTYKI
jgi:mRNA-degrading endonuclease RelE of RelBE toxin-antitoxin system